MKEDLISWYGTYYFENEDKYEGDWDDDNKTENRY